MKKLILAAALAAGLAVTAPVSAQESVYTPGGYMNVQGIYIEDGQFENYMDYIADRFRRSQEFARSRGWISAWRILVNVNQREDEPDLYLITEMPRLATPAEEVEREQAMNAAMRETTRQATAASGQRVRMRRLGSNMLLQELNLRPAR